MTSSINIDEKIMNDLNVVNDKMNTCDSMLLDKITNIYPSTIAKYDSLMGMIGYLEACAPRMMELIEAAAQGMLSETVLVKCLEINDRLTKILSDIKQITFVDVPAVASAAGIADNDDDLLLMEDNNNNTTTTNDADLDDFDAFLNERTSTANLKS